MNEKAYFFTNGHPKNCQFRSEVKKITMKGSIPDNYIKESVSGLIGSADEMEWWTEEIKFRNLDIFQELIGDPENVNFFQETPLTIVPNVEEKQEKYVFKIAPMENEDVETFQKSFVKAMKKKNFIFCDDLKFPEGKYSIPKKYFEEIQTLSTENLHVFEEFKVRSRKAVYAPLTVEVDPMQGYIVRANRSIPVHTLICEYTGSVMKKNNSTMQNEDSLFEYATIRDGVLVIVPNPFCNLGRFISGINNFKKNSKKNVESMKFRNEDNIHVVLYSKRKIEKGEILYYDYNNDGRKFEYDTSHFI